MIVELGVFLYVSRNLANFVSIIFGSLHRIFDGLNEAFCFLICSWVIRG